MYLSWLLGERPSEFSKFNFNISQVKHSLRGVAQESGKWRYQYGWLDSPSPRTLQRTFLQQDGPYRNKVPSSSEEAGINSENVLNRGRRVFNASNINLLSISFNLFTLGPFHIFQDVIIFVIPITSHCKSTTIVLNTVSTTDNQHFFVIYFIYFLKNKFQQFQI